MTTRRGPGAVPPEGSTATPRRLRPEPAAGPARPPVRNPTREGGTRVWRGARRRFNPTAPPPPVAFSVLSGGLVGILTQGRSIRAAATPLLCSSRPQVPCPSPKVQQRSHHYIRVLAVDCELRRVVGEAAAGGGRGEQRCSTSRCCCSSYARWRGLPRSSRTVRPLGVN